MQPFTLSFCGLNDENLPSFTAIMTSTRAFDLSAQMLIGCLCNDKPCGIAAVELSQGGCAELLWIEVVGGLRRRGIGSNMLQTFIKCLKALGVCQLTAAYSEAFVSKDELESFLLKNSFSPPVVTQKVYLADFEDVLPGIREEEALLLPQMESQLQPLAGLPPKTARALKQAVQEKRIPAFVLPENAVGELLEDYSLAYTEAQSVFAAIMYSALPGVLYLDAVYLNQLRRKEGQHLVFFTLYKALTEYTAAKTLAMDAINHQSLSLVEHFACKMPHHCQARRAMRINI